MAHALHRRLLSKDLLRRAWHWSVDDARSDFIGDPLAYYDFGFDLDGHLEALLRQLRHEPYRAQPLLRIDVPKAPLAVRPGSVPEMDDRIVAFAAIYLLAPAIDRRLPDTVYSFRLKKTSRWPKSMPFEDREIVRFPLLKGKTIRRRIVLIEPWYKAWPAFREAVRYAYEEEGYTHLVVSDIAAYFENIDLVILKGILAERLPREQRLINLLMEMMRCWTWPTTHGGMVERGLPQGTSISRFLGNAYLLPLDDAFGRFCRGGKARYFRYMDDVKILCKSRRIARQAVLCMNECLRYLHLNMQGAKTGIRSDEDIREELYDDRVDRVSSVINELQRAQTEPVGDARRAYLLSKVNQEFCTIPQPGRALEPRDLRLYRRVLTAHMQLEEPGLVHDALQRIRENSDDRLMKRCLQYACMFPRRSGEVGQEIDDMLTSPEGLFELEEALLLEAARYLYRIPTSLISYAGRAMRQKRRHWYVRVQAALLVEGTTLRKRSLDALRQVFEHEPGIPVRRALVKCLCQYPDAQQAQFLERLLRDLDQRICRTGRMLSALRRDPDRARAEIRFLFRNLTEHRLLTSFYRIEVVKHARDRNVRELLLQQLHRRGHLARAPALRERVKRTIEHLKTSLQG